MMRLRYLYRCIELRYAQTGSNSERLHHEKEQKLLYLKKVMDMVTTLNEPRTETGNPDEHINAILELTDELKCPGLDGSCIPLLEEPEIVNLKITKGSLNGEERKIIESHVDHTYMFVSKIPWPDEYKNIPHISRKHHEKLDGSGYPLGLKGREEIQLESRIMAIVDIFDALSAADRPYKKAVPNDRIFSILREEANAGKLDSDLVELFITQGGWKIEKRKTEKQEQMMDELREK